MTVNVIQEIYWKVGDPVLDTATRERNSSMIVNLMDSIGSAWDPVMESESSDMIVKVMSW